MAPAVGVDWASGRWVVVAVADGAATVTTEPAALNWWREHRKADAVLVDVPVGLPERGPRACDEAARDLLGDRRSTVFRVPGRAAVEARDYEAASAAASVGVSSQLWGLVPRIREVDALLAEHPAAAATVYESHPEVCYARYAARTGRAPPGSKRDTEGVEARLELLTAVAPAVAEDVRAFVERRRTDAAWHHRIRSGRVDDVLDAAVLAVLAAEGVAAFDALPAGRAPDEPPVIVAPRG